MKIINNDTGKIPGITTVLYDEVTNKHFLVTTIIHQNFINKTFISECDKNGNQRKYHEFLYEVHPADHFLVLERLENGILTAKDFDFINK